MDSYKIGDILYFLSYYFTDTNECAPHYAMVVLPSILMEYESQILCCVITSNQEAKKKKYCISLSLDIHKCFNRETFCCLNRRDIESLGDLDLSKKLPLSILTKDELKKCFKLFKNIKHSPIQNNYFVPVIVREWKRSLIV